MYNPFILFTHAKIFQYFKFYAAYTVQILTINISLNKST